MNIGQYQHEAPPGRVVLDNGAVVLTVPIASAQSIALGVWLRHGTQDEPAGLGGMTHFLEHIVFKGSNTRSAFDIARQFDSIGAAVDAYTTKDHVAFTVTVLPEYFPQAVDILADMLLNPALDPELVELEKDVVCEEIHEVRDTPEDLLHEAFVARIFGNHPRSRPILGSLETVKSFTPQQLRDCHDNLFRGPNMVISVAGNLPKGTDEILDRHFGPSAVRAGGAEAEFASPTDAPFSGVQEVMASAEIHNQTLELKGPVQQCYFEIGNKACSYLHEDRVPLAMLMNLLGGGMSSRIFQAVREREGLAYSIYNYTDLGREIGLVSCAGACSPAKLERLLGVVRSEYALLLKDGVEQSELDSNRAQIKSQIVFSLEGVSNQMQRVAKDEIFHGRFQPVIEIVDLVDRVDREILRECAARYCDPDRFLVAIHGPGE
jgi:predicted Zn-dependent peptidase